MLAHDSPKPQTFFWLFVRPTGVTSSMRLRVATGNPQSWSVSAIRQPGLSTFSTTFWRAVEKFRISALRFAPLPAGYASTLHSRLVAPLDLRNLLASVGLRRRVSARLSFRFLQRLGKAGPRIRLRTCQRNIASKIGAALPLR
jgi:hypothetical protein